SAPLMSGVGCPRVGWYRALASPLAGRGNPRSSERAVQLALGAAECQEVTPVLDDRKLDVLRAIVEDFVSTNEPVGSKSLVEKHHHGVAPPTIRNDMAT